MSYQALYRRWRPSTFDDVVGQNHITKTLKNEILTNRVSHAYLFTGIRGTGKTSVAKILSRAVNCENNTDGNPCNECRICKGIADGSILDVVEIDAASNNGVDNIRNIRDEVVYAASEAKYRVYIIDEVHMLSSGAFNALLKTLEEPPQHVIFILATTEVQKLPQTILSRCQRFDFHTITFEDVADRLDTIARADNITVDRDALILMADMAEGSMRDAISILDKCIAFGEKEISYKDATDILGIADEKMSTDILSYISDADVNGALTLLSKAVADGKNPAMINDGILKSARNLLMAKFSPETAGTETVKAAAEKFTKEKLINCINVLSQTSGTLKFSSTPKTTLEISLIKLCMPVYDNTTESMADRIATLEKQIAEGVKVKAIYDDSEKPKPEPAAKPKEKDKPKKIKFGGEYNEKWKEITEAARATNPGLPVFMQKLKAAGRGDILVITAETPDAVGALNFVSSKENFRDAILDATEKVCGVRPKKVDFAGTEPGKTEELAEKLAEYDFIEIYE